MLCPYGGWVHLKCTNLLSVDEWNSDFVCHRCSWCCPEVAAEENSSSDNEEVHDLTEALALAAVPPQIGVTSNEMSTAKQRRRKRNREARRAQRRDKREQALRESGKRREEAVHNDLDVQITEAESRIPVHRPIHGNPADKREEQAEIIMVHGAQRDGPAYKVDQGR